MRKTLLFFILLVGHLGTKADGNVVYVGTEYEFINALSDNTTIIIKEGTHLNISGILNDLGLFSTPGKEYSTNAYAMETDGKATVVSEEVYDGQQLTLMNFYNLTIRGEKGAAILSSPRYSFVINLINCENVSLECLTLGHTEEGYCCGGVIGAENCVNLNITDCDLYGCGTYGLDFNIVEGFTMTRCYIRDCSYGIMQLMDVHNAIFSICDFIRNKEFTLVSVDGNSSGIRFSDCRFAQNEGPLFSIFAPVCFTGCEVYHAGSWGNASDDMIVEEGKKNLWVRGKQLLVPRNIGPANAIQ